MKNTIIHLGVPGPISSTTFSELAYRGMMKRFPFIPRLDDCKTKEIEVPGNSNLIPKLLENPGAWAVIPIETASGGKIDEVLTSITSLTPTDTISIIAAYRERISFSLHTRSSTNLDEISGVLGHPRALHACRSFLRNRGLTNLVEVDNNATGFHLVKTNRTYATFAALGPRQSSQDIQPIVTGCEDEPAYTTFLLAHNGEVHQREVHASTYRALVSFNIPDTPGMLCGAIGTFENWNMRYLQSSHESPLEGYRFIAEIECSASARQRLRRKLMDLSSQNEKLERMVFLGPYPVIESDR